MKLVFFLFDNTTVFSTCVLNLQNIVFTSISTIYRGETRYYNYRYDTIRYSDIYWLSSSGHLNWTMIQLSHPQSGVQISRPISLLLIFDYDACSLLARHFAFLSAGVRHGEPLAKCYDRRLPLFHSFIVSHRTVLRHACPASGPALDWLYSLV